jgi:hypothetical protein
LLLGSENSDYLNRNPFIFNNLDSTKQSSKGLEIRASKFDYEAKKSLPKVSGMTIN